MNDNNLETIKKSLCIYEPMEINNPYYGFTRYLAQAKESEDYMASDMRKNIVFYEPYNKRVFKIFDNNLRSRKDMYRKWNSFIIDNHKYIGINIDFVDKNLFVQKSIINIFSNPTEKLAEALQEITENILKKYPNFDICLGVSHGEQIMENNNIRYPHIHILLRSKYEE